MATEYRNFEITVPAGTAQASPQIANLAMPPRRVSGVRIRIPPGPSGQVGFALGAAGTRVIPYNAGAWYVGDNEVIDLPLSGQITSGAWQLQAYNLGAYDHTLYVSFALDPLTVAGADFGPAPLAVSA